MSHHGTSDSSVGGRRNVRLQAADLGEMLSCIFNSTALGSSVPKTEVLPLCGRPGTVPRRLAGLPGSHQGLVH